MKLAEALARRKDIANILGREFAESHMEVLTSETKKISAAAIDKADEDVYAKVETLLAEARDLSVLINRTNNAHAINFEDESMTLMEAIVYRDNLMKIISVHQSILESVNQAAGLGRHRRYASFGKDDVRTYPVITPSDARKIIDTLQGRLRRLDVEIQKANWSVDLG